VSMAEDRVQTTFRVDAGLLKKFRHALLERETKMTPVIEKLIREWLQGYSFERESPADEAPRVRHSPSAQISKVRVELPSAIAGVDGADLSQSSSDLVDIPARDRAAQNYEKHTSFEFGATDYQLNPRYLFESFVVGESNAFAHAAAQAVAEQPSKAYNPLFLYSGVGMGKTHLMQAVGHLVKHRNPNLHVSYISAEKFTNEVIHSLRFDRMMNFRDRFRSVDVLLVDDIQFIAGKERTQEEFFHTFNALYDLQRQIVISSDSPPKEIAAIEERLRSRFEWGLIADIQPPDLETKIAILQKKAESECVAIPDDVAEYIARAVKSNVRELEGALTRLIAYASLTGSALNLVTAQQVLRDTITAQEKRITIDGIQTKVGETFGLREQDLKARSSAKAIAFPRQIAMYVVKQLTSASLNEIGRHFGGKHPSTVLHSINKIDALRRNDKDLNRMVNKLIDSLS